jgi:hypothetical protein
MTTTTSPPAQLLSPTRTRRRRSRPTGSIPISLNGSVFAGCRATMVATSGKRARQTSRQTAKGPAAAETHARTHARERRRRSLVGRPAAAHQPSRPPVDCALHARGRGCGAPGRLLVRASSAQSGRGRACVVHRRRTARDGRHAAANVDSRRTSRWQPTDWAPQLRRERASRSATRLSAPRRACRTDRVPPRAADDLRRHRGGADGGEHKRKCLGGTSELAATRIELFPSARSRESSPAAWHWHGRAAAESNCVHCDTGRIVEPPGLAGCWASGLAEGERPKERAGGRAR